MPDHGPTLSALEGIKSGAAAPLSAAGVLEPVYDAMGEWEKLISVLEVQIRFAEDPYAKVDLLHRVASLYEESLGDHASAFDTYARAVRVDSQNEESLGSVERLGMMIERWPAVARLYDEELQKLTEEPERVVELGLRVAQVYEVQLEDVDNAAERRQRVTEHGGDAVAVGVPPHDPEISQLQGDGSGESAPGDRPHGLLRSAFEPVVGG